MNYLFIYFFLFNRKYLILLLYIYIFLFHRLQHNNANEFLEYLTDFLERQCRQNQNIYLMGDFNTSTCSYTQTLLQTMQSFSMFPVVDKPTRVYGNSATLIDNIFINNPENNIVSGNIVSDTTGHLCIINVAL